MIIKLTGVNDCMIGGKFPGKEIEGTRIDNGERWGKNFFADKRDLRNQLDEFGIGDVLNIKMVQDGKYWNIESITEASEALIQKAQEYGAKDNGGGGNKPAKTYFAGTAETATMGKPSNTEASIARAVALKIAVSHLGGKAKMTEEKIIASAKKYLPYLLDEKEKVDESAFVEDALTPPTVD